jgi:hypothetical protein
MYDEQIPMPDMDARLYLAPPWTGAVITPPHFDGHGTQTSLHRVLMGGGHNLVHVWPRFLPHQEWKWRQSVGLPPPEEPQPLPHDICYTIDSSSEVWDVKREANLREFGISSSKFEVRPGQAIVLPAGMAHVFKKIGTPSTSAIPVPLLGYAGDCSYVGPSAESFVENWLRLEVWKMTQWLMIYLLSLSMGIN